MTMAIQGGARYAAAVTVLPLLLLLSYKALDIPLDVLLGSILLKRFGVRSLIIIGATNHAVLSALTVPVTGLIIRRIGGLHGGKGTSDALQDPYVSINAMLVESYALESVWSILSAITYGLRSPAVSLFVGDDSTIKVIVYFLVVYRVANGRGWTSETERKLTSLQWNRDVQIVTDETSCA